MTKSVFSARYAKLRNILIDARLAANLTQDALASRLGRPQSYVSKYERGERRLDVVEFLEIAGLLQMDASDVLGQLEAVTEGDPT